MEYPTNSSQPTAHFEVPSLSTVPPEESPHPAIPFLTPESIRNEPRHRHTRLQNPPAILDRLLEGNGVETTYGNPPFYHRSEPEPGSKFLRDKLGTAAGETKTQIFIPELQGEQESTCAYVAYAWVMIYAQRQLEPVDELPDPAPPGFAELRAEIPGHANGKDDVETLRVKRLEASSADPAAALFVIVADKRPCSFQVFPRQSDLRCDHCDVVVDSWESRQARRREVHGLEHRDLPEF